MKLRSSLTIRLYRRVLILLALTGLGMGAILYVVADHEIGRASDAQLVNASRLLYMLMQDDVAGEIVANGRGLQGGGDPLLSPSERQAFHASYDWCMFAVFWEDQPVAQSGWGAPIAKVPRRPGLHNFKAVGDHWRSYGLVGHDPRLLIVVAERQEIREISPSRVLRELAIPLIALIAASMVVLWWTLRRSLYEVQRLATTLGARSLADLQPLRPREWSRDLGTLIVALNKLFVRLDKAYEREQAFTDDVAHELRTPLAAIRAQAQLLRRTAPLATTEETTRLIATVDRANHLIDGLLTLARLDSTVVSSRSVDVHQLIAEVVAEKLIELPPDAMEFTVAPDRIVRWRCDPAALQIAVAAVIDNAAKHAREGGRIDIAVTRNLDRLTIGIADRGPGVPEADRERLMHRFERGEGSTSGSGLGLSIAAKAMALSGGTIRLENLPDHKGLLVVLAIPELVPEEGAEGE
ncbi:sensor histidine kinase [Novosphingobium sp. 9]|uniref:sensor histidine kinase n=1 Tax=Novosphingobium sp. 9 TaxID=2025349 RepID=UPI0021B62BC6|nr:HAMP domain-containing sensor histidine kinase [Novosphingobium sp. 9]